MNKVWLDNSFRALLPSDRNSFDDLMSIQGVIFRQAKGRETLRFKMGGEAFFIKKHFGIGVFEWVKNLLHFRRPIMGAENEIAVIHLLEANEIDTMTIVGYGFQGRKPFWQKSFIATKELRPIVGLRDLAEEWPKERQKFSHKKAITEKIAVISRKMHEAGIAHRDFYLAHFQLDANSKPENPRIYLIDLHRSIIQKPLKMRWIIKDLSSLYFSSMEAGLTKRDIFRFLKKYFEKMPLRDIFEQKKKFLDRVEGKAKKLYRKRDI